MKHNCRILSSLPPPFLSLSDLILGDVSGTPRKQDSRELATIQWCGQRTDGKCYSLVKRNWEKASSKVGVRAFRGEARGFWRHTFLGSDLAHPHLQM